MRYFILFPNQLFEDITLLYKYDKVILLEDSLFFSDANRIKKFNGIRLVYIIAAMRFYESYLKSKKIEVLKIKFSPNNVATLSKLKKISSNFDIYYPFDHLLLDKYKSVINKIHDSPHFLDTYDDLKEYFLKKDNKLFQTSFYRHQRIKFNYLMDKNNKPIGGKLTYDTENRDKLPKKIIIPNVPIIRETSFVKYARKYVKENIPFIGDINSPILFPLSFDQAKKWYRQFLKERLKKFGQYQDAITYRDYYFLFHSAISPAYNVGFLTQKWIADSIVKKYNKYSPINSPINSIEGVLRQVIGWNSFCRAYYVNIRVDLNKNIFKHKRKLNTKWYTGETGIIPVDHVIKKAFKIGYLHHIERLMIMLNIMILCEIDYREIYRWHSEYSLDSYDYLMIYNIYSMGFADGGVTTTKPYITSSNYILKMSDFPKTNWVQIWDDLYYRFLHKQKSILKKIPRMKQLYTHYDAKSKKDIQGHVLRGGKFIETVTE